MIGARLFDRGGTPRFAGAAAILFVGAAVLGWAAGETPVPPPPAVAPAAWSIPARRADDLSRDLALLQGRQPWSSAMGAPNPALAAATTAAAAAQAWRLAGVIERGEDRFALIANGAGPAANLKYVRVGDRLPDGSVLTGIAADSATAASDKAPAQRRVYRLFGEKR